MTITNNSPASRKLMVNVHVLLMVLHLLFLTGMNIAYILGIACYVGNFSDCQVVHVVKILAEITDRTSHLAAQFFDEGISKLVHRYDKCLNLNGDYVEK